MQGRREGRSGWGPKVKWSKGEVVQDDKKEKRRDKIKKEE